ncbi:interleukin 17a/f1 [Coregonus clupeaformis]|uniref:interleukin 17a/f1 n=1 Tax=Coregonus clupeaformis TaxID=59861 RepID=UPI001BE10CE1|nr:interleukin 17a/f1 [Coregonus clupeaformis]
MGSTSNVHFLMVLCVMGVRMMMMGAEAAPHAHPGMSGSRTRSNPRVDKKSVEPTGPDTITVPLHLDPSYRIPSRPFRPIWNHSISPWTYNTTYDESRFPPFISEVRCSLEGCLNVAGKEDRNLESKPIYHQILVLRKVMGSGDRYHYRLESKIIAVGCTCVRPSIEHQQ